MSERSHKIYRLFGKKGMKRVKFRLSARNDNHAGEQALAIADGDPLITRLTRLVEVVKRGEYRDVPFPAQA